MDEITIEGQPISGELLKYEAADALWSKIVGRQKRLKGDAWMQALDLARFYDLGGWKSQSWHRPTQRMARDLGVSPSRVAKLVQWGRLLWWLDKSGHVSRVSDDKAVPKLPATILHQERLVRPLLPLLESSPEEIVEVLHEARTEAQAEAQAKLEARGEKGQASFRVTTRHVREAVERRIPPPRKSAKEVRAEAIFAALRGLQRALESLEEADLVDAASRVRKLVTEVEALA